MARRGFFAEMQHQAKVAAREKERAQRQRTQAYAAAVRQAEQAQRKAERAATQAARAAQADRKRLEKEAREAHLSAMQAEVDERNAELSERYDEIDSLLAATLDVDDHVDLEALRRTVELPFFDRPDLELPTPPPAPVVEPREPVYREPEPPKGLLGRKKKQEEAIAAASAAFEQAHAAWQAEMAKVPAWRKAAQEERDRREQDRLSRLAGERARYEAQCAALEAEVDEHNRELDTLIANLGYGTTEAVEEYINIVLSSSVYPDHFPVAHTFAFDPSNAELSLRAVIPGPDAVPSVKSYKYAKSTDEITEVALTAKAAKDRYASAAHQVALRSLHEVFEADRRGLIKSISLEVGTETIDPATGLRTYVPFVAVGADRDTFMSFDLSAVVPSATLNRLGASVSKNPYGLVPATTTGVRRS